MITTDDILQHFGVKGMKWGVRKKKDEINSHTRTIKKGTTIQNISSRKLENNGRHMYGAYTSYDKDSYVDLMGNWMYGKTSFKNNFVVKKDIKLASDRELVKTFVSLVKKNPEKVAEDMANAHNDVSILLKKSEKHFAKKLSKITDEDSKRGEQLTKQYITLMVSDKSSQTRAEFLGSLIKKGYDGMSDANDRDSGAQDPLIIFKPSKSLGLVKSVQLTNDELEKYYRMTNFDSEFQKKRDDLKEVQR